MRFTLCLLVAAAATAADPFYTHFHAQPLKNWLNDPNGPMYINGKYHLFFQYNPESAKWGDMHWYHMVSTDMLHWKHLPVALAPDQSYDCGGIFSGSATVFHNESTGQDVPVLTYSVACGKAVVNAFPADPTDPDLTNWTKPSYNPVIQVPASVAGGFRDPTTAWQGKDKAWRMLVGCGAGEGTCEFKSRDFVNWTYTGPFHKARGTEMWECPDFYRLPGTDAYVLKASDGGDWWTVGQFVESADDGASDSFVPASGNDIRDGAQKYDFGTFYASKTFLDPVKNRQVLFGWVNYNCPGTDWTGVQTFPREVTLDKANATRIVTYPIEEIGALATGAANTSGAGVTLKAGETAVVGAGDQLDVQLEFSGDFGGAQQTFGVRTLMAADGSDAQQSQIVTSAAAAPSGGPFAFMPGFDMGGSDYLVNNTFGAAGTAKQCEAACDADDKCKAWTWVDPTGPGSAGGSSRCCLKSGVPGVSADAHCTSGAKGAPPMPPAPAAGSVATLDGNAFYVGDSDTIKLRLLVDHSIVEVYAQEGRAVATRPHCPKDPSHDLVQVYNNGPGDLKLVASAVQQLATANVIPQ